MAFDFGAGLTAVGNMQPAYQAQRQQEAEQRRAQIEAEQKQRYNDLLQKTNQQKLDTEKKQWIKIGEPYVDATGATKQRWGTPDRGIVEDVQSNAPLTYAQIMEKSGFTEQNTDENTRKAIRMLAGGVPPVMIDTLMKNTEKNVPGTAGQPYKGPDGKWERLVEDNSGNMVVKPMPDDWVPPDPKLSSSLKVGVSGGKNVYATETPQGWKSTLDGSILKDFRPLPTYAQIAPLMPALRAKYEVNNVTDDQGQNVDLTRLQVGNAAMAGHPYGGPTQSTASGLDKKNQMLALSAINQVDRMEKVLQSDPSMTGPGGGQLTKLQTWLGTQDPDASQFLISSLLGSEHGVAVFGGRNIHTINDLNNAIGNMKTNPKALKAALDVIRETMQPWVTAGGRLPTHVTKEGSASLSASKGTVSLAQARNLPQFKGKSDAVIKAAAAKLGYEVVQ